MGTGTVLRWSHGRSLGPLGGTPLVGFLSVFCRHVDVGLYEELCEEDGLLGAAERDELLSFGVGRAVLVDVNVRSAYSPEKGRSIRLLNRIQGDPSGSLGFVDIIMKVAF